MTTYERGRITAHAEPITLHSKGITLVAQRIMPTRITTDKSIGNQNLFLLLSKMKMSVGIKQNGADRLAIFGISKKKLDRSTSFTVADHWMLYENRWAKIAWVTGIERPPKKKKLPRHRGIRK